ncbi:MAG: DegT/DnrJ/EryC1/StrS family aminotransferase, partial [Cyclobacteriaceae bacterium]|nr:DegT/DnrJ/EryC1/StrS family aminotransferase [Cyclobacteriaceae bacterium]
EFERQLKRFLNVPDLLFLSNGTIALQIAIKALGLKGEVITTPFSYVATTSTILWEGCIPVYVDVHPGSLNIDPSKIEAAITERTSAILATHVYGNPCDIDSIDQVAKRYNLRVIYDAAHCFGTTYKGRSVFVYGDISTTSFHATKVFHTIEGGAVFASDDSLLKKMELMRNFGHQQPEHFAEVGINAKNSEFHAAMGLANLKYADDLLKVRKDQHSWYDEYLKELNKEKLKISREAGFNYAYFPVLFESEAMTTRVVDELERHSIFSRRYFYPGLNGIKIFNPTPLPFSESYMNRVLCLPLYHSLTQSEIEHICQIITRTVQC